MGNGESKDSGSSSESFHSSTSTPAYESSVKSEYIPIPYDSNKNAYEAPPPPVEKSSFSTDGLSASYRDSSGGSTTIATNTDFSRVGASYTRENDFSVGVSIRTDGSGGRIGVGKKV